MAADVRPVPHRAGRRASRTAPALVDATDEADLRRARRAASTRSRPSSPALGPRRRRRGSSSSPTTPSHHLVDGVRGSGGPAPRWSRSTRRRPSTSWRTRIGTRRARRSSSSGSIGPARGRAGGRGSSACRCSSSADDGRVGGLRDAEPRLPPRRSIPRPLALICYTSGSTSRPKAVMHTHRRARSPRRGRTPRVWHLGADDTRSSSLPLAWAFGLVTTSMATLTAGGRVILLAPQRPARRCSPGSPTTASRSSPA